MFAARVQTSDLEFAVVILAASPPGSIVKINLFLSSESCRFAAFSSTANVLVAAHRFHKWLAPEVANDEMLLFVS